MGGSIARNTLERKNAMQMFYLTEAVTVENLRKPFTYEKKRIYVL